MLLRWLRKRREKRDEEIRERLREFKRVFPGRCPICSYARAAMQPIPRDDGHYCPERRS